MTSLCPRLPGGQSEVVTASVDPGPGEWPPDEEVVRRLRAAGCVFAEDEAALLVEAAAGEASVLDRLVSAREAGDPLEPLLGWVAFGGRRVMVGAGVFVPRVRTELLAEQALALVSPGDVVVELCCGVAAVAAALQADGRVGELYAADVDPAAVGYARRNVAEPGVVLVGDLYDPLPNRLRGRIDLLVANAPYVPSGAIALMPREARDHEPLVALDGGVDGVDVQRRIITGAPAWLRSGGSLLIETGREQAAITAGEMRAAGLTATVVTDDERDATVVVGTISGTTCDLAPTAP
jgi:release factor glutamine methyltransferase